MKKVINTSFKIVGMLVILFLCGCEKEELPPCNKVVQGEFVEVK